MSAPTKKGCKMPGDLRLCTICGLFASEKAPLYKYGRDMERLGRRPGLAHYRCVRREREKVEAWPASGGEGDGMMGKSEAQRRTLLAERPRRG